MKLRLYAWVLALGLCLGCSDDAEPTQAHVGGAAGSGGSSSGGTSGSGGGGAGGAAGSGGVAGATGDFATFQDILLGKLDAKTGTSKIAAHDGFPVQTPDGFLFVHVDDGQGPYALVGDHNGWQPTAMKAEAGLYWVVSAIQSPDGVKYKFQSSAPEPLADPLSRRFGYDSFGEFSWVRESPAHLERWFDVGGSGIASRTLRIRVPAGTATHHLYVHDGQNLFDPNGAFGSWKLDEAAGPATLLVGIDNAGGARMDEYTHVEDVISGQKTGGNADAYADYVHDVVRPFIETRYGMPQKRGVMGSSLGGLVSFHEVLRHPGAWDYAASLSGTFGWGSIGAKNETLIARFAAAPKGSTKLYLDSGGGPGSGCVDSDADGTDDDSPDAEDNYCETLQLRDVLAGKGYAFDQDLWHWWEPSAPHNEAAWAARVFRPLQHFEAL
ncbi:MAG: alpha/beta hydrolase-fold protein [Polyangiaceae bacterium]